MPAFASIFLAALCYASVITKGVGTHPPRRTYYSYQSTEGSFKGYYLGGNVKNTTEVRLVKLKSKAGAFYIDNYNGLLNLDDGFVLADANVTGPLSFVHRKQVINGTYAPLQCNLLYNNLNCFTLDVPDRFIYTCGDGTLGMGYVPPESQPQCPDYCGDGTTQCPPLQGIYLHH